MIWSLILVRLCVCKHTILNYKNYCYSIYMAFLNCVLNLLITPNIRTPLLFLTYTLYKYHLNTMPFRHIHTISCKSWGDSDGCCKIIGSGYLVSKKTGHIITPFHTVFLPLRACLYFRYVFSSFLLLDKVLSNLLPTAQLSDCRLQTI